MKFKQLYLASDELIQDISMQAHGLQNYILQTTLFEPILPQSPAENYCHCSYQHSHG